jgi:hypothetical protein
MAAFNKFNDFAEQLLSGVHNFASHTFRVVLTNTAPVATNTILANITQISNGNGYTTGGTATTMSVSETSGTARATGTDVVFTATGAVGPFRYAVLYNDTATSPADALVGWWDYGSAVTLANTETFTVDFDGTNGILALS